MISAYYTFHVYIMHHFSGGGKYFTGVYSKDIQYPKNIELYISVL